MRIVFISDTHDKHWHIENIPKADILVHTGDITAGGDLLELESFNDWIGRLDFKHKIVIAGNHDFCFENNLEMSKKILTNCTYLQDQWAKVGDIKFYGTPWQPRFNDWAFNLARNGDELKSKWDKIPDDTNILLTHCPPFAVLDRVRSTSIPAGCELLSKRIAEINIDVHAFGHVHEGYGVVKRNGILNINSSIMTYEYEPSNQPILIEI